MGVLAHPYHPSRLTDGGLGSSVPRPSNKKNRFLPQWRAEEGQSGRTFQPQRPHNSTWTRGGRRHQGVKLDFQRHVMNYLSHLFNLLHLIHIATVSLLGWKKRVDHKIFDPECEVFFLKEQPTRTKTENRIKQKIENRK